LRAFAVLVFPWIGDEVVVCDICGRGWCIPSGRVEPNESSVDAVRREALEEAGAVLHDIDYIGCYHISERGEVRWADCYAARVSQLVDVGMPEESKGVRVVGLEELADIYHLWNPLTRMVFEHSREILRRKAS
jgi:8-oxo-dGTP diphosphatase